MNLRNLSEKEFDAKIKEQLEDSSVAFEPASWNKMSRKLDLAFPDSRSGNGRIFELLVIALLLSGLFFWNVGSFSQQAQSQTQVQPQVQEQAQSQAQTQVQPQEQPQSQVQPQAQAQEQPQSQAQIQVQPQAQSQAQTQVQPQEQPQSQVQPQAQAQVQPQSQAQPQAQEQAQAQGQAQTQGQVQTQKQTQSQIQTQSADGPVARSSEAALAGSLTSQSVKSNSPLLQGEEHAISSQVGSRLDQNGPEVASALEQVLPDSIQGSLTIVETPPVIHSASSPWLVGFGYAPDISLVGFDDVTEPGTNLGLQVEYQLNRRWSVQSGITYSMKKYIAGGDDYNPPEGFWYYGVIPDYTDATCDVIDIPLNLRLYLSPAKINRFFLSTGLSSYLMLTEDYDYHYEEYYGPNLVDSWSVRNDNRHYFGVYNFSIGYQHALGKQWFMEIEPFIKVPLAGVGFGQIDLWSTGSFFSLKYNFK